MTPNVMLLTLALAKFAYFSMLFILELTCTVSKGMLQPPAAYTLPLYEYVYLENWACLVTAGSKVSRITAA